MRRRPKDRPSACGTMDALPLLFPQKWMADASSLESGAPVRRPFIRILESARTLAEPSGSCRFFAPDECSACAVLSTEHREYRFTLTQDCLLLEKKPDRSRSGMPPAGCADIFTEQYLASPDETDGQQPDAAQPCTSAKPQYSLPKDRSVPYAAPPFLLTQPAPEYCDSWQDLTLKSQTRFDRRPVFCQDAVRGLQNPLRGTLDYQDGRWLAALEDLDFICLLPKERLIRSVGVGFLSNHRSGIVYPDFVELYLGRDENSLTLCDTITLPCRPIT